MIGKLRGIIDSVHEDHVLVDVNGVCYAVFVSAMTAGRLREGAEAVLWIETHVREDHIHLYGFASEQEKAAFRLLLTVSGVGSKMALSILSVLNPEQIISAILAQDQARLTQAPGVGAKLAARIVNELKDKVTKLTGFSALPPVKKMPGQEAALRRAGAALPNRAVEEAIGALVQLGYSRTEAFQAVQSALAGAPEATLEQLIKAGLKALAVMA